MPGVSRAQSAAAWKDCVGAGRSRVAGRGSGPRPLAEGLAQHQDWRGPRLRLFSHTAGETVLVTWTRGIVERQPVRDGVLAGEVVPPQDAGYSSQAAGGTRVLALAGWTVQDAARLACVALASNSWKPMELVSWRLARSGFAIGAPVEQVAVE